MPTYAKIIERSLKSAAATPPTTEGMSKDDIERAIAGISAELKGSGVAADMRLVLNEDRKVYRHALEALK